MTKWEYMYVEAIASTVSIVNGKQIGTGFLNLGGRPNISDFLREVGKEGWEAVGMSVTNNSAIAPMCLLLKRPVQ
jgi:hypothetical protein